MHWLGWMFQAMIHGPCFVSSLVSSRYTIQLTVFYALPSYLCSCCILSPVVLTKCLISAPLSYSNNHTCINGGYTGISYNINHIPERIVQGFALLTLSRRQSSWRFGKQKRKEVTFGSTQSHLHILIAMSTCPSLAVIIMIIYSGTDTEPGCTSNISGSSQEPL